MLKNAILKKAPALLLCAWLVMVLLTVFGLAQRGVHNVSLHSLEHLEGKAWLLHLDDMPMPYKFTHKFISNWDHPLVLYEKGKELGPADALHVKIIEEGSGAYSFYNGSIIFSTSDGSEPVVSDYTAKAWSSIKDKVLAVYLAALFCLGLATSLYLRRFGLRTGFCCAIVFVFTLAAFIDAPADWEFGGDADSYPGNSFKDPWGGMRTPGYAIYLDALGVGDGLNDFMISFLKAKFQNKVLQADPETDALLKRVVWANIICLALGFALLTLAMAKFVPVEAAAVFSCLCVSLGRLSPPSQIMTADQPGCCLTVLFMAFGLLFIKSRRLIFLVLLCLCAVAAMLVKPGMAFLPLIAGIMVMVHFIQRALRKEKLKAAYTALIGCFLCVGTLLWPLMLYLSGGIVTSSQISGVTKMMFAVCLVQPGDENLFEDPKHKAIVAELIRRKPEVDKRIEEMSLPNGREAYSEPIIYLYSVGLYGWWLSPIVYSEFYEMKHVVYNEFCEAEDIDPMRIGTGIQFNCTAGAIADSIIKAHFGEYLKIAGRSFLSGFGYYPDFYFHVGYPFLGVNVSHVFPLFCGLFAVLVLSIAVGTPEMRYPVAFVASVHPLAVLIHSIGHAVLGRYLEISEWSLLLALLLALYSLIIRLFRKFKGRKLRYA